MAPLKKLRRCCFCYNMALRQRDALVSVKADFELKRACQRHLRFALKDQLRWPFGIGKQ